MSDGPEISAASFGDAFRAFLEQSVNQQPSEEPPFVARLAEHLGVDPRGLPIIMERMSAIEHPNVQAALDSWNAAPGRTSELVGMSSEHKRFAGMFTAYLRGFETREEAESQETAPGSQPTYEDLKHRLKFCYAARSYEHMDRERVRALKRCIEAERPDWVEQVRMATLVDNDVYTIVHFSGVPPYPAVAILENLLERGEIGPPE